MARKPKPYPWGGKPKLDNVYFIRAVGHPFVKIGKSSRHPSERMASIQTNCPFDLELLGYILDPGKFMERRLHARFFMFHLRGEWFRDAAPILEFAERYSKREDETGEEHMARLADIIDECLSLNRRNPHVADMTEEDYQRLIQKLESQFPENHSSLA